jgi:hypothetical protein
MRPPNQRLPAGVMKSKKQPTRDDLAAALRTIRNQYQIIKLPAETIRRQEQLLGTVLLTYPRLAGVEGKLTSTLFYGFFQAVIDFSSSMISLNRCSRLV